MTAEQQKRVEEIRALLAYAVTQDWTLEQNFNETPRLVLTEVPFLLDLLREQQAEVERETAVRKTAESEAHNHAIRTAELYIEREELQAELEALRKAVNLTLGFMDCCDWNDEDSERDAARVVSACRETIGAAVSESQSSDVAATDATEPESTLCDHGKDRAKQFCEEYRLDEDSEAEMPGGFNG